MPGDSPPPQANMKARKKEWEGFCLIDPPFYLKLDSAIFGGAFQRLETVCYTQFENHEEEF